MAGRPKGSGYALSEWEVAEMCHYLRVGWTQQEVAWHYGICTKTVQRIERREGLRADSRRAGAISE